MSMVSNPQKLIMAVLLFFLALTYVRGVTVNTDAAELVVKGELPVPYGVTITNSGDGSIKPIIEADGPLTVELISDEDGQTIPGHSTKKILLFISSTSVMKVGETYSTQLRVITPDQILTIPLKVTKEAAPFFSNEPNPSPTPSPASGLIGLLSANAGAILDGFLIIVIVALLIALFSRVKNRVGK